MNVKLLFLVLGFTVLTNRAQETLFENDEGGYTFVNKVRFPFSRFYDPFIGIIIAFDIKLTPSMIDADFSWNIEANYFLPQNESEYSFPPIVPSESSERGLFDRAMIYRMIELKLESFSKNYGGKNCLLRLICEMSLYTSKDTDILGDLVHIILSPTSSLNKNLSTKYVKAETYGKDNNHCKKYIKKCPINVVNFFSVLGELLDNTFME